ncbi:MAG: DNA mismatch repair endonuclease MutL, partial [Alphaproteobacteria bacterium]|nr:DNA mismatch repair endonuclease MutL [Alphaproteobacteria bacterium]
MKIRRLPENLINQIAAGEVVERPASALKELIENSIDAKATQIDIVLDNGGKNLISVSDNGIGIDKDHITLAIERHATSKLPNNDLNRIDFLGFRGEALPSIAAVSELTIQTKSESSTEAWALDVTAGNFENIYPSPRQQGTIISVKNLFYATPARLKFLKSSNVERSFCHQIVLKLALVNPVVGFRLQADGRELINLKSEHKTDPDDLYLSRIRKVMGSNFADEAIKIKNSRPIKNKGFAKINGFIGLPTLNKSNYSHQFLFINGRSIQDRNLSGAIRAAYGDTLPKGRFPIFCLYIDVPSEFIDVNVHPGKTEVRFEDNALIRSLIVGSISRELNVSYSQTTNEISKEAIQRFNTYNNLETKPSPTTLFSNNIELSVRSINEPYKTIEQLEKDNSFDFPLGVALAQFSKNYIISRNSDGIVIVDQHAAHERLVLEKMKAARENKSIEKQILLLPEVINLDPIPLAMILDHIELMSEIGFVIEPFGEGMIVVREIPALLGDTDIKQIIVDLGDDLSSAGLPASYLAKVDLILGNIACHRSVRSGRILNENEMN